MIAVIDRGGEPRLWSGRGRRVGGCGNGGGGGGGGGGGRGESHEVAIWWA